MTKSIFTTGQVAKLTGLCARTVAKVVDQGLLPGFRVPGSTDRRIPRDSLIAWAKTHEIPLNWSRLNTETPTP